ncbi:MAG: hypothetical protein ACRDEB_08005, partial [Chitinophagaceae bacterium]
SGKKFLPYNKFTAMKHYHIISRIAIYLLSVVLILFGIYHFMYPRDLLVYVPVSLVGGIKWAYVVGAAFILVGISFLTNQFVKFTGYLLAILLIIFILTIHVPNYLHAGVAEMKRQALMNILKDTAIMGFALHVAAGAHHQHFHLEESD